ncbi:MAG: TetR/AcrR family transcriptional regulator [Neisseriaceae bacterium]|nr:TetR/AcrR family transcriptional regulator [Neisseriaceae bacterium]MBP6863609.1 TetR/AcrR family transcriptional regulator [Neisseriaceae bacterium]
MARPAGRPRTFDRHKALCQAMDLFWQYGYEATSLSMLKAHMGNISSPSFYAAFGSKEQLFLEAFQGYMATHGQASALLYDDSVPPLQAIENVLRQSARAQTQAQHPKGCFVVLATATCAPEHQHLQARLAQQRAETFAGFERCIERAIALKQLPQDTNVTTFATLFNGFLLSISSMAQDGTPLANIDNALSELLKILKPPA